CTGGSGTAPIADIDGDGYYSDVDCSDQEPLVNPGAVELCDGLDNDCDGKIDEEDAIEAQLWFIDADGDGYGYSIGPVGSCEGPPGYINNADDCDDSSSAVSPAAIEVCDGVDNDCDGLIDEDSADDAITVFRDFDGDSYGNPYVFTRQCAPDGDYVNNDTDCDDSNPLVHPGGQEVCDLDGDIDEDCDGLYDDEDPSLLPDEVWYLDDDGDGYGDIDELVEACLPPEGYVGNDTDCDDEEITVNPEGIEICADGVDNDCDTLTDADDDSARDVSFYVDDDGDGYGDPERYWQDACEAPARYAPNRDDCDDTSAAIRPGAAEIWYDGIDQDCDGGDDYDADADGSPFPEDCDDGDDTISPDEIEVCGDGIDNDCDEDVDPCAVGLTLTGEAADDEAGWVMALADINGDAVDDLILGAPYQDSGATGAGAVYFVTGPVTADVDLADVTRLDGGAVGDALGWSVAAGDLDDDGVDDLLVGAYRLDGAVANLGGAYLFSGPITGTPSPSDAVATLLGEEEGDAAGWVLATGGDLDNDGVEDLLISAVDADSDAGRVYAVFGPVSGTQRLWGADMSITGESSGDALGHSAAFAGDLSGDGISDLVTGAPEHSDTAYEGAAVIVFGEARLGGAMSMSDADGFWLGESGGDAAGTAVAAATDFDGDGYDDILVGAPGVDGAASGTGAVYLILGPASGEMTLADAAARLEGRSEDDAAGSTVAVVDRDIDGVADLLLVGAPGTDRVVSGGGAAYLVEGPLTGTASLKTASAVLYGDQAGIALGTSLLGGDVDGDGIGDALIGTPDDAAGEISILLGGL
ncbi:MAG: hypothetical protein ACI8S6_004561, partial [Myxococcota bacterium]